MTMFEKVFVALWLALAALFISPALVIIGERIIEQATSEAAYPYTGFCPDCPGHEDDEEGGAL